VKIALPFLVSGACVSFALAQPPLDLREVTRLAQGAVNGTTVTDPIPGFELVILRDGQTIYQRAFGQWSVGQLAAADSATKTISGAVVMAATEATSMTLSSRLVSYIPEFSGDKQNITIRQSFAHTSGLQTSSAVASRSLSLQQVARVIATANLLNAPGTAFAYDGTSMHAAGAAVEVAVGRPWNDFYIDRIAQPLGMTATRYVLTTPNNPRIGGGCESTAREFVTFMEMLRRGGVHNGTRVLRESSVQQMFTRQSAEDVELVFSPLPGVTDYGVGVWLDQRDEAGNLLGALAAGARGFSAWIDFDDGITGCFATDLSRASNVMEVLYPIREAVQEAVRRTCVGDFNLDGGTDGSDVEEFFAAWSDGLSVADVNRDGGVDGEDVEVFFAAWSAGC
jgi:CubicO group peptidase (beta-lactamase class C family)